MAGSYSDVPGPFLRWDLDGSVLIRDSTELTGATKTSHNSPTSINQVARYTWGVTFPEPRDIVGACFGQGSATSNATVSTSTNTTNGIDGTWTQQTTTFQMARPSSHDGLRTSIRTVSYSGIRGIRFLANSVGGDLWTVGPMLFGTPAAGNTRWLMITDTSDVEVGGAYFDFADVIRGGADATKQFKVKNGHATLTANTVTVGTSTAIAPNKSPSFADDYTFSTDDATYTASLSLGNLAPGASSGTLYVKRVTPVGAVLGAETGYFTASAASWS